MAVSLKKIPATSKDVRVFFEKNPTLIPEGAETSVRVSCKGRISTKAVEVYNKHNKSRPYSEGNVAHMPLTYKAKNHREVTVMLPKAQVRALAGKPGSRGPLSKADLDFAAEVFVSQK